MPYTFEETKTYPLPVDALYKATLGAIEGSGGELVLCSVH